MAFVDTARPPKVTNAEKLKQMRDSCINAPCLSAGTWDGCPFCPHWKNTKIKMD